MSSPAGSSRPVLAAVPPEGEERSAFIAMLKAIRCEGVPKVTAMMQRLEREASAAKRDTARVAATRAHLSNTFQATQMLYEIEQGVEHNSAKPTIQILVAAPGGESREPNPHELRAILDEVSESVMVDAAVVESNEG